MKKQVNPVVELLKRGKARLATEDALVRNWNHMFETKTGRETDKLKSICRMCIIGAVDIEILKFGSSWATPEEVWETEREAKRHLRNANGELFGYRWFTDTWTLKNVHRLYNKAIKLAKLAEKQQSML